MAAPLVQSFRNVLVTGNLFYLPSLKVADSPVTSCLIVVGASRGIGLGLVKHMLQCYPVEYRVIATCRSPDDSSELSALRQTYSEDKLVVVALDTTQKQAHLSVLNRLSEVGITTIDVLIANAGISSSSPDDDPPLASTPEDLLHVFNTNVVGSMLTLQCFHGLLCAARNSLVVVVSSKLGSIELTAGSGLRASYRVSKAALNMLAMTYAEDSALKSAGAKVICLHPGMPL